MLLGATFASVYMVKLARQLDLPAAEQKIGIASMAAFSMQVITLATISCGSQFARGGVLSKLLYTLPLSQVRVRLLAAFNHILQCTLLSVLVAPALYIVLVSLGIESYIAIAVIGCGTAAGLGSFYWWHTIRLAHIWVLLMLAAEYVLVRQVGASPIAIWYIPLTAIFVAAISGLARAGQYIDTLGSTTPAYALYIRRFSWRWWFLKKVLRSPMRKSLLITLLICLGLAFLAARTHFFEVEALAFIGALVAASCAADIRTTSRARKPAEITALRGTPYFVIQQVVSAASVLGAICPLLILIALHADLAAMIFSVVVGMLGISIGLLMGAVFTPAGGDISSQFVAVLSASGTLLLIQQSSLPKGYYMLVLLCTLFIHLLIEYVRNPYVWRNRDYKKSLTHHN